MQETEDATHFLHYFIFDDEQAEERHRASAGVKQFTDILYPELSSDTVEFKRYHVVASTQK